MPRPEVIRVLAAVDPGNPLADPRLAGAVLDAALRVAEGCEAELHLVHAWSLSTASLERRARPAEVNDCLRATHTSAARALATFLATGRGALPAHRVWLVRGQPVEVIARVAEQQRIAVVVIGTSARRGISGVVVGNTAERLVQRLRCDLLVVKAPDFVCPIRPALPTARIRRGLR
jgi:universal stress protein E